MNYSAFKIQEMNGIYVFFHINNFIMMQMIYYRLHKISKKLEKNNMNNTVNNNTVGENNK